MLPAPKHVQRAQRSDLQLHVSAKLANGIKLTVQLNNLANPPLREEEERKTGSDMKRVPVPVSHNLSHVCHLMDDAAESVRAVAVASMVAPWHSLSA